MTKRTDTARLAEVCEDSRRTLYPALSRDGLLTSPRSAIAVCNRVREGLNRTAREGCTDEVILRAWLNASKQGKDIGRLPRARKGRGR